MINVDKVNSNVKKSVSMFENNIEALKIIKDKLIEEKKLWLTKDSLIKQRKLEELEAGIEYVNKFITK